MLNGTYDAGVAEKVMFEEPLIEAEEQNGNVNVHGSDDHDVVQFGTGQFDVAERGQWNINDAFSFHSRSLTVRDDG